MQIIFWNPFKAFYKRIWLNETINYKNKTKDWTLVQNAALAIDWYQGVEVRLGLLT